jgi:hypothetical protein
LIRGNLLCAPVQGDHQYGRLPIYFPNVRGQPFDLRLLRAHDFQYDGFLRLAAVMAGGGLQREALNLFGNHTHNNGSSFVLGINTMNSLPAHLTVAAQMDRLLNLVDFWRESFFVSDDFLVEEAGPFFSHIFSFDLSASSYWMPFARSKGSIVSDP